MFDNQLNVWTLIVRGMKQGIVEGGLISALTSTFPEFPRYTPAKFVTLDNQLYYMWRPVVRERSYLRISSTFPRPLDGLKIVTYADDYTIMPSDPGVDDIYVRFKSYLATLPPRNQRPHFTT